MNREWLSKNPVSADMKPPIGASRVANKAPYTDEELPRITAAKSSPTFRIGSGIGSMTAQSAAASVHLS